MRFLFVLFLLFVSMPGLAQEKKVPTSQEQLQFSYAPVVKRVAPAVVNIYTERVVQQRVVSPFANDPFFAPFFSNRLFGGRMRERVENTLGSGVIVSSDGLIVTNAHVLGNEGSIIEVQLNDGRQFEAKLELKDEPSDIALLRITSEDPLPFVSLQSSEDLEVGDIVLAIGNPFGVGQTVTSGIVSATARAASNVNDFNFFIQTDAAINPGNSGGPLVSLTGGVVGINTAIFSRSGGSLGIGFSVPSEMVAAVIAAAESGQVSASGVIRPWLGASGQDLNADLASGFGIETIAGVVITEVHPRGPAYKAGLRQGDVITALNGRQIRESGEMKFRISTVPLGQTYRMEIIRKGKSKSFEVEAVPPVEIPARNLTKLDGNHIFTGVSIINISPAVEVEYGLKNHSQGVIVTQIDRRSPIRRLGLREGDGVLSINGEDIKSVRQMQLLMKKMSGNTSWKITIRRNGQDRTILLRG